MSTLKYCRPTAWKIVWTIVSTWSVLSNSPWWWHNLVYIRSVWKSQTLYLQFRGSALQLYPGTGAMIPLTGSPRARGMGACLGYLYTLWCLQNTLNTCFASVLINTLCWFFMWPNTVSEPTSISHCLQMSTNSFMYRHKPSWLRIFPHCMSFSSKKSLMTLCFSIVVQAIVNATSEYLISKLTLIP